VERQHAASIGLEGPVDRRQGAALIVLGEELGEPLERQQHEGEAAVERQAPRVGA
jgi:hypothetical protein